MAGASPAQIGGFAKVRREQGMIGLVLVTHGRLAVEFVQALEHVVGPQENVAAICIGPEDDMEQRRQDIIDAVAAADEGDGVVLLTDMFGGTPSNLAIRSEEHTYELQSLLRITYAVFSLKNK